MSKGWLAACAKQTAWNALLANDYHTSLGNVVGNFFKTDGLIAVQVEV